MAGNSFGQTFRITTFGESHGPAIGVVIDGCPSSLPIDLDFIQTELDRRKPGQSSIASQRKESDKFEILSGVYKGKSTGAPIAILIRNEDAKPADYAHLIDTFRPSHADYTYFKKYGNRDPIGGGRSSARETACRVAAGAVAKLFLNQKNIVISAYTSAIGEVKLREEYKKLDLQQRWENAARCPDEKTAERMIKLVEKIRKSGDSIGGVVTCVITGVPAGLGEPVFDKLQADLAKAMLSINAAKGFEYGSGFMAQGMKGSQHNDFFFLKKAPKARSAKSSLLLSTISNYSGGIQGGISNGEDVYFNVAFKPASTIMRRQPSFDVAGNEVILEGKGRHDPCIVPRAVSVVEAMAALVIIDHILRANTNL